MDIDFPEEIYRLPDGTLIPTELRNERLGRARKTVYHMGYVDGLAEGRRQGVCLRHEGDPISGLFSLTEALKKGVSINMHELDGRMATCLHPEFGVLQNRLDFYSLFLDDDEGNWYLRTINDTWTHALNLALTGDNGWALWIEGPMPIVKKTADELPVGTCFKALHPKDGITATHDMAQTVRIDGKVQVFCHWEGFVGIVAQYDPAKVEVLEVYGVGQFGHAGEAGKEIPDIALEVLQEHAQADHPSNPGAI